jgi:hypothetical protein
VVSRYAAARASVVTCLPNSSAQKMASDVGTEEMDQR